MKMHWFIGLACLLCCLSARGQCRDSYQPAPNITTNNKLLKAAVTTQYQEHVKNIASPYKDKIREAYADKLSFVTTAIDSGLFYFDDSLNTYFQNIFQTILQYNPELKRPELKLYLSRYTFPNAFCLGEGTLVFNIGLLRHLKTESQVAFVICHELAHQQQNHVFAQMQEMLAKIYSKETMANIKSIQQEEFYVNKKIGDLLKSYTFDTRKHSRYKESEADSLGLLYLLKTPYNAYDIPEFMNILDSIDHEKYRDSIRIGEVFNFPQFPFDEAWIEDQSPFMLVKDTTNKQELDSLKTHPDCKHRQASVESWLGALQPKTGNSFVQGENTFRHLVYRADFECVENRFRFDNIDGCMYLLLKLLPHYPENAYLHATMGKCLNKICSGMKEHKLSNYVNLSTPFDEGDYKVLNRFLNAISLSEANKLYFQYMMRYADTCKQEEYLYYAWQAAANLNDTARKKSIAELYKSLFPKGKYVLY